MFKKLIFTFTLLAGAVLAQPSTQVVFDNAYWAAQPPAVASCQSACTQSQAQALVVQGYKVDVPIDVWGWDPYLVMSLRQQYGYTWVPAAGQPPVTIAPGLTMPGVAPYDPNNPPAGSIKVSLNLADYPPFQAPPAPANTVTATVFVGSQNYGCVYYALAGDPASNGAQVVVGDKTFTKVKLSTPFGFASYYTLNGCQ